MFAVPRIFKTNQESYQVQDENLKFYFNDQIFSFGHTLIGQITKLLLSYFETRNKNLPQCILWNIIF